MTSNRHHLQTRPPRRTIGILLLLFALAVALIAVLPSSTPVALAARLFQSPVEPPTATPEQPTPVQEQPTPVQEQPTQEPATPTEVQQTPVEQATFTPEATPAQQQSTATPVEQTPAESERAPEGVQEPGDRQINWAGLIDTTVMVFSWFWLACGVVVVIVVVVLIIVIFRRSKRRQK